MAVWEQFSFLGKTNIEESLMSVVLPHSVWSTMERNSIREALSVPVKDLLGNPLQELAVSLRAVLRTSVALMALLTRLDA